MGILANSWVIGIVTGIVSGLLVFFATTFLFDNKRKREYAQHKKEANADVINALKPYIAEQGLPDYEVLCSLINSTSRKYYVNTEDMLTPSQVCEELIREIMSDVYITSEKKKEYAESVAVYKTSNSHKPVASPKKDYDKSHIYYIEKRMSSVIMSVYSGVVLVALVILIIISIVNPEFAEQLWNYPVYPSPSSDSTYNPALLLGILTGVGALFGSLYITIQLASVTMVKKHFKVLREKVSKKFEKKKKSK